MNSPLPPRFDHLHSPYDSSHGIYTPDSEASFDQFSSVNDSDRYSEAPSYRTQSLKPKIVDRQPPVAGVKSSGARSAEIIDVRPLSTMAATAGKDYLYYSYKKGGSSWEDDAFVDELPAAQAQIKKKVEARSKKHNAMLNLRKMGKSRLDQINEHIDILNANEIDGSTWEPVYIDNTKIKQKGNVMEVKAFEIIFARKAAPRITRASFGPLPNRPLYHDTADELREEKHKKEKKKKEKREDRLPPRGSLVDDPFGESQWFDNNGTAIGGNGAPAAGVSGLPPFIPPEKPIGAFTPRIIPGYNPEMDPTVVPPPGGFGAGAPGPIGIGVPGMGAEDMMRNMPSLGGDGGIFPLESHHNEKRRPNRESRDRGRRGHTRSRSRSRSVSRARRPSIRDVSHSSARNVRFSDGFSPNFNRPGSSGSSIVSGDFDLIFDEVEELSSRTSEDTSGSTSGRKIYRVVSPPNRQHQPGPLQPQNPRRYELASDEKVLMPARSRRRSSRAIEQIQPAFEYERQPLVRRNTSPRTKAIINQPAPLQIQTQFSNPPPIAEYPSYYEERDRWQRERNDEQHIHDYMRNTVRERNLRDREDDVEKRERVIREGNLLARREQERKQREVLELRDQLQGLRLGREFGTRRGVYNHEPREQYGLGR